MSHSSEPAMPMVATPSTDAPTHNPTSERVVAPAVERLADDGPLADASVKRHFTGVVATGGGQGPIGELATVLATGRLDSLAIREVLDRHGAEHEPWFRRQLLDLVLGYVDASVGDAAEVSSECLANIRALRTLLHIPDGEFIALRPAEVASIVRQQLARILDDAEVSQGEELEQVELQAAFGLGYDDYLALARTVLERTYADVTAEEARATTTAAVEQARRKLAALEPVYRLAVMRPRSLGALL